MAIAGDSGRLQSEENCKSVIKCFPKPCLITATINTYRFKQLTAVRCDDTSTTEVYMNEDKFAQIREVFNTLQGAFNKRFSANIQNLLIKKRGIVIQGFSQFLQAHVIMVTQLMARPLPYNFLFIIN